MALTRKSSRSPKARQAQDGFTLLSVLWLLLLATVLLASIALITLQSVQTRSLLAQELRAKQLIDAAFETVLFDLITEGRESRWAAQDGPVSGTLGINGASLSIHVSADSGKADLNAAPDELLLSVFNTAGLSSGAASSLLFNLRSAKAKRADLPRIATLTELRSLFESNSSDFACVEPHVTVFTGARRPNVSAAGAVVKASLPANDQSRSVMAIQARTLSAQVFRVRISVSERVVAARVLLTGNNQQPYWLYDWLQNGAKCQR